MGASESAIQREDGSFCNSIIMTGTDVDPNSDADVSVVNDFLKEVTSISECSSLQLTRLWQAVIGVVQKFLHNSDIIASVTKACHLAAGKSVPISSPSSTTSAVVSSVLSALSSFNWKEHPSMGPVLINLTGNLFISFQLTFSSPELVSNLAAIYCKAFDTDSYSSLTQPAIACGKQFPLQFSISLLRQLDSHGVHRKLRMLVGCYDDMEKEELAGLLRALIKFLKACPSSSNEYVEESSHLLLLFAAQKFATAMACQLLIWEVMMDLCKNSPAFMSELDGATMLSAVFLVLQAQIVQQNRSTLRIVQFLLLCCTKYPATIIPASLNSRELMTLFLGILETSNEVSEGQENEKILMEIANFLALLCTHIKGQPTVEVLMQYDIIGRLKEATEKWPTLCILPTCTAIDSVLAQFPPDLSSLPFFLRGHFNVNSAAQKLKQKFYNNNHARFIKNLLENQAVTTEHRLAIYSTTSQLFKNGISPTFVNKPFLETLFSKIFSDFDNLQHETRLLLVTVHSVINVVNGKELTQAVLDLDVHTKVVNVLSTTMSTREFRSVTLNLSLAVIRLYHTYLQNITSFAATKLPSLIVILAKQVGLRWANDDQSEATEYAGIFSRLVLSLTADKNLSDLLHSQGYMQELYSLVSNDYEPQITRSSIHAIGNIALNGHDMKQSVLNDKFHEKLFTFLDQRMVDTDALTLSACCRVLRILGSGDSAKRQFAESGIVSVLLRLLHTRTDLPDLVWQSLGLLASIGFMALVNKCYVLTKPVLRIAHEILNSTTDAKVAGYTVLLSLAAVDLDMNAVRLRELGFVQEVQKKIEDSRLTRANPDLQRWAITLLEKSSLFTLSVSREREEALLSTLKDSLTWPEVIPGAPVPIENDSMSTRIPLTLLPKDDERFLVAQHPSAPSLSETDKQQLSKLGLSPDQPLFRVGRLCGNNHTSCSNCDSDDHSEELVFRPHGLTPHQYQCLIDNGWYRRGAVKMYRFRYNHSLACSDWETRVVLSEFSHRSHKSYRKVLRRVPDSLTIETIPTQFVRESFELYNEYHIHKHNKPSKSEFSYAQHAVNSPVRNETIDGIEYGTFHQLYRLNGKLVAVGLIDIVPNGVVSLYMWYAMSKEMQKLSLGVYSALKEIEFAQKLSERNPNIKYYYLQGWNGSNHKLSYKANYTPGDFYSPCTVTDWVCGLDGVKKAQEEAREKWRQAQEKSLAPDQTDSVEIKTFVNVFQPNSVPVKKAVRKNAVPGDAIPLDRVRRERLTGSSSVDVGSVVMCLNHQRYLSFRELVENYQLEEKQRELLETRLEELVLAVGPELSSNMVVDMKACPSPTPSS